MTLSEKRKRRAKLRNRREKLEDAAIEKAHELDVLERRREELKKRDPRTEENIAAVKELLADNHAEIAFVREREDELESAISKLTRRIKKLSREIRASVKPKVVNLNMSGPCTPQPYITGTTGHYTAGPLARTDEEAVRMWWTVRAQHMSQGWSNIGYSFGIGPEGGIYILRGINCIGAHTLNNNTGWVGASVHGTTGDTWTKAQKRAFRYALKKFNLIDKPVKVHKDFMATACPGSFEAGYRSKGA